MIQEHRDVTFVCVYVPPQDSPYYDDASDGIAILENCLTYLSIASSDCLLIHCGDFNSRTSDVTTNFEADIHDMLSIVFASSRKSQDSKVNDFGKMLLSLSLSFNLTILNGLIAGDERGKFTYISPQGNSVTDYFIVSTELITRCKSQKLCNSILSSHMPVELTMTSKTEMYSDDYVRDQMPQSQIIWNPDAAPMFLESLRHNLAVHNLSDYLRNTGSDIDGATACITSCIIEA